MLPLIYQTAYKMVLKPESHGSLVETHCLPIPESLDVVSLRRNLYFNNLADDFNVCQILKPSRLRQCQYDRKQPFCFTLITSSLKWIKRYSQSVDKLLQI